MPVEQKHIVDILTPDVYIGGITLEASASPLMDDNPHISHAREYAPEAENNEESNMLVVTVDLSMEEKLDDSLIASWFAEQQFTKYLKLFVVQSTDSDATDLISKNTDKFYKLQKLVDPRIETRVLSVANDVLGDNSQITQHFSSVDSDGNSVHEFTYRVVFYIPNRDPKHLSYFAASYLDVESLVVDFDLDVPEDMLHMAGGNLVSEIVIDGGGVVSTALSEDGEGVTNNKVQDFRDVVEIQRLEMDMSIIEDKALQNNQTIILNNDNVSPHVIPSYFTNLFLARDIDGNARFSFGIDFHRLIHENSVFGKLFENSGQEIIRKLNSGSNVTNLRMMRRRIKQVRTQNHLSSPIMGKVEFDDNEAPWLVAASAEKSGIVVNNETARGAIGEIKYIVDEDGVRFFTGMDKDIKDVTDGHYQYGVSFRVEDGTEKYLFGVLNNMVKHRNSLQRYLNNGSQLGMTKYLLGVDDPHIEHEAERAAVLVSSPGSYDPVSNRFTQYFADTMMEAWEDNFEDAPWIRTVVYYLYALHLLTNALDNQAGRLVRSLFSFVNPYTGNPRGVMVLMSLYDNLISNLSGLLGANISTRTTKWMYPNSFEPADPMLTVDLTNGEKNIIEVSYWFGDKLFDSNVPKNAGYDYISLDELEKANNNDGLKVIDGGDYGKRIDLETLKYFKNLGSNIDMTVGNRTITRDDKLENTDFTFLSPSFIHLPDGVTSLIGESNAEEYNYEEYSALEGAIVAFNADKSGLSGPTRSSLSDDAKKYGSKVGEFFADMNFTVEPLKDFGSVPLNRQINRDRLPLPSVVGSFGIDQTQVIDPVIPVQSDCDIDSEEDPDTNTNSILQALIQKGMVQDDDTSEVFDLNNANSLVGLMSKEPKLTRSVAILNGLQDNSGESVELALKSLPNQIKSLLLDSTSSGVARKPLFQSPFDFTRSPNTSSTFRFNYALLYMVEVLSGFGETSTGRLIKEENWTPLTRELYNGAVGEALLCKLKPFVNMMLSLYPRDELDLPIYDEYFILTPPETIGMMEQDRIPVFPDVAEIEETVMELDRSMGTLGGKKITTNPLMSRENDEV